MSAPRRTVTTGHGYYRAVPERWMNRASHPVTRPVDRSLRQVSGHHGSDHPISDTTTGQQR